MNGNKLKMSKINIRKAKVDDAGQIAEVMLEFYNMKNANEAKNAFRSELEKGHNYIIAIENKKIIGLITWVMHGLPKHGLFELDRICVLNNNRGKGVGNILVKSLIEDARHWYEKSGSKIRKLYLLTHDDNKSAQLFYQKVGFKYETKLENHYYDDKDERMYSIFFHYK